MTPKRFLALLRNINMYLVLKLFGKRSLPFVNGVINISGLLFQYCVKAKSTINKFVYLEIVTGNLSRNAAYILVCFC